MQLNNNNKLLSYLKNVHGFIPIIFINNYLFDDVWIVILKYLDSNSLILLLQTCKSLYTYILKNQLIFYSKNKENYKIIIKPIKPIYNIYLTKISASSDITDALRNSYNNIKLYHKCTCYNDVSNIQSYCFAHPESWGRIDE